MSTSRSRSRSASWEDKDPTRVKAGLKAAVHNPRVAPEVKERDKQILEQMGENPEERRKGRRTRLSDNERRAGMRREGESGEVRMGRRESPGRGGGPGGGGGGGGGGGRSPGIEGGPATATRRRMGSEGIRGGLPPEAEDLVLMPTEGATYEESENSYDEPLGDVPIVSNGDIAGSDPANVLRGYKATLRNPRVSQEAKRKAEQVLRDHGEL